MILEEGSPSHQNSAVTAAGLHMSASSCLLERTSKKQKRTHGMIETSPIYNMNNNGRKEQDQYYNQHGFYPEHHTLYNQDDPSAAGHGTYHRPTGSYTTANGMQNYNTNDNTQYPYWQQRQQHNVHSQYYNGAQNMVQVNLVQLISSFIFLPFDHLTSRPNDQRLCNMVSYSYNNCEITVKNTKNASTTMTAMLKRVAALSPN